MRNALLALALGALVALAPSANARVADGVLCPAELPAAVLSVLNSSALAQSNVGVLVAAQNATGGFEALFDWNSRRLFQPASNNKVLTTAAAYMLLGVQYQFSTQFFVTRDAGGNLQELCIRTGGDPSLTQQTLQKALAALQLRGPLPMLVVDNTHYTPSEPYPLNWEAGDLAEDYGAQPTAPILDENTVGVVVTPTQPGQPPTLAFVGLPPNYAPFPLVNWATTGAPGSDTTLDVQYIIGKNALFVVGSLPSNGGAQTVYAAVIDPAGFMLGVAQAMIAQMGLVANASAVQSCNANGKLVSSVASPNLAQLMNHTLKESDNLYAEVFMRELGANANGAAQGSTFAAGLQQVAKALTAAGVDPSTYVQDDGSGLSRHNLVSPQALFQTLTIFAAQPTYRSFLPVAGVDGTLAHRFVGTPAQGIVQAKTGSEAGVNSLSGYMQHPQFPLVIFSIIANDSPVSATTVRNAIDSIVITLTQLRPC